MSGATFKLHTLEVTDVNGDPGEVEVYADAPNWSDGGIGLCDESGDVIVDGPAYRTVRPFTGRPGRALTHVQPVPLRLDPQAVTLAEALSEAHDFALTHKHPTPAALAARAVAAVAGAKGEDQ